MPRRAAVLVALVCALLAAVPATAKDRTPSDPWVLDQWHLDAVHAFAGWATARASGLTVAVVDSGIDLRHRDLRQNLWTNPGEVAGNGVDDDRNGWVDDVHGADVVQRDGDPQDEQGHGTHVAGLIGARGNNRRGGAGIAWRVKLMAVRVLDEHKKGTTTGLAAGIDYAVRMGARIVNVSVNFDGAPDPDVEAAVARADAAGALVVASAGNTGLDLDVRRSWPVCSPHANVVGVAALDRSGALADFSSHGSCADVAAPGEDLLSTRLGGGVEDRTGTSQAAPLVAGAAALLWGRRPGLSAEQVAWRLRARGAGARAAARAAMPVLDVARALR